MRVKPTRYSAILAVHGDPNAQTRALRKACKLLLRVCGVRLIELRPVEGRP
jgi:hypothetical protein